MMDIFMALMVMIASRMYIYTELYSLNMYSSLNVSHTSIKQFFFKNYLYKKHGASFLSKGSQIF